MRRLRKTFYLQQQILSHSCVLSLIFLSIRAHLLSSRLLFLINAIAEEHGVYSFVAQLVGHEGGKGFVGGSMICDPLGRILVEAPVGVEAIISAEIDLELVSIARAQTPLISDLQSSWHNILKIANEID